MFTDFFLQASAANELSSATPAAIDLFLGKASIGTFLELAQSETKGKSSKTAMTHCVCVCVECGSAKVSEHMCAINGEVFTDFCFQASPLQRSQRTQQVSPGSPWW